MDEIYRAASGLVVGTAPELGDHYRLPEMQTIVGGYIEIVPLDDGRVLVVNEEGKVKGLPVNLAATLLFERGRDTREYICGDALVTSRRRAGYEGEEGG